MMAELGSRYGKSFAMSIGLHLVAAAVVGLASFAINKTPSNIMEVTLVGGGGGGGAAASSTVETINTPATKDDIVDKKLKQESLKSQQTTVKEDKAANNKATGSSNSAGNGVGEGSGTGTGTGNGSGSGTGSGSGSGSGLEKPVVPPRLLGKTNPRYPLGVRSRNITGTTSVRMLVNEKGKVVSAGVASSSGNGELDASAVECVYKWKFSPAKNGQGNAVQCYITIPIKFTIN